MVSRLHRLIVIILCLSLVTSSAAPALHAQDVPDDGASQTFLPVIRNGSEEFATPVPTITATATSVPEATATATASPTATPTATDIPLNLLDPIGDRQAPLGRTLTIQLTGDSTSGQPISYDVAPLPLPETARFEVRDGLFTFRPTVTQTGTYTLTFSATDGQRAVSETITITVPEPEPNAPTALRGRILDANDASEGIITPLAGATVRLVISDTSVTTDADGWFELSGLPEEAQYVEFDGTTTNPTGTYGAYRSLQTLIPHVTNVIERPIYLMAIDTNGMAQVIPEQETTLSNPTLGVTVTIPADTVMLDDGTPFSGTISVSEVPTSFTPSSLPGNLNPAQVLTIQPMGLTFENPAPVTFPNVDDLPPGTEVNIWSMDHETSEFFIAGKGRVSEDGAVVETIEGGIQESSWHFLLALAAALEKVFDDLTDSLGGSSCDVASTVTLHNGSLRTSITLPGYVAQDGLQTLSMIYQSERAYPQLLAPYAATIPARSAVPKFIGQYVNFAGKGLDNEVFLSTENFSESKDETFRSVAYVDTSDMPTGVYPYDIRLVNFFRTSTVAVDLPRRALVVNNQDSPFGAGWELNGLSRLYTAYNGRLLLVNGEGTAKLFRPEPFDLRSWSQEGVPGNGDWVLSEDGRSVLQRENGNPTFFVSPDNYINTSIRGTFRVGNNSERSGDYIGFVFGYQSPLTSNSGDPNDFDFLLFSWKESDQNEQGYLGAEGFSLSRVQGNITDYFPNFWGQTDSPEYDVLATDFGAGKGWRRNVDYDFELTYTANRIRITINEEEIFNVTGVFPTGRFGFYNFSQEQVRYSDFSSSSETSRFVGPDGDFSTITRGGDRGTLTHRNKNGVITNFEFFGRQTERIDPNGNRVAYAWDAQNRLQTITDPVGGITTFAYDGTHLRSATTPDGRITTFTHDGAGNLTDVTFPDSTTQTFTYDGRHLMTAETDRRGNQSARQYDTFGRLVSATLPDGTVRQHTYAQVSGLVDPSTGKGVKKDPFPPIRPEEAVSTLTDGEGHTTTYDIGELGRPSRVTDPAGFVTTTERDDNGNPLQVTLPSGAIYTYAWDNRGNMTRLTDATVGGSFGFTYESVFNQVTSITDPFGDVSAFAYDTQGNLIETQSSLGRINRFAYNSQGLPRVVTDTLGTQTAYTYDGQGNPTQVTTASGMDARTTVMAYTAQGYLQSIADPLSRTSEFIYDPLGRLTEETLPGNRTVAYSYDADGNLTSLTPPDRPAHGFAYDTLGQVTVYTPPAVSGIEDVRTTYTYNKAQQLTRITQPGPTDLRNRGVINYGYDDPGRLTTLSQSRGQLSILDQYGYDDTTGHVSQIQRTIVGSNGANDVTLDYGYQGEFLTSVQMSGAVAGTVGYAYDKAGRLRQDSVNGGSVTYGYDGDDALTQAGSLNLSYDAATGLYTGSTLASTTDSYAYNGFAETISYTASITDTVLYATDYAYDPLGRITAVTETITTTTTRYSYAYDEAGRLASVIRDGVAVTYAYNANGNRTTGPDGFIGTYDNQDRLLNDGNASYSYTANGELLTRTENGKETRYNYDVMGNLMGVTLPDGKQVTYIIDGQDRRVGKRIDGNPVQGFLYQDQLNPIAELDGSGNIISRFVYASSGIVPDYMIQGSQTYRIISDHLGSVRLVVDVQTGTVMQRLDYDAWGKVLQDTRRGFQPFGFAGGLYDADTGLVRFGARDYDASVGRWTTKDPIGFEGNTTNLYSYAHNNPIGYIDPSGNILDTVADVGFITYDLYRIGVDNIFGDCDNLGENLTALGLDVAGLLIPFVTGGGLASRTARNIGRGCSFDADTLVATKEGQEEIRDIESGDLVLAYNETTRNTDYYPVVDTIAHEDSVIVLLTIDGETLETTPEHPFYVMEAAPWLAMGELRGRWIEADDLEVGDQILQSNGTTGKVDAIVIEVAPQIMYNLSVADAHTFFVGDGQWLVHNTCPIQYPKDFSVRGKTKNWSAWFNSERDARALAREKIGHSPLMVEPNKWRSRDGKWQYRAKPGDLRENHIHLEELNPETGEVLQNLHLRWK